MAANKTIALVTTIKEKCRVCYTCVRECPAKAIRIAGGQAEVINERCIGCGNCVRVCSQKAKKVYDSIDEVLRLIKSSDKVAACIAPSFPAEFTEYNHREFIGILRKIGFDYVVEVAFGADLVSRKYKELIEKEDRRCYVSTPCPAIVSYVEKYYPDIVRNLAPIDSPMIAIGKVVHRMYGNDVKTVFIGPCIAKKSEAIKYADESVIDSVVTFSELRNIIKKYKIAGGEESDFDPPYPFKGVIYPVGGGLLQSADLKEDILHNDIISTEGTRNFVEVIKEFGKSDLNVKLLDLLCCEGCIMGPGFTKEFPKYARQSRISEYARSRVEKLDKKEWEKNINNFKDIDLSVNYKSDDQRINPPSKEVLNRILKRLGKKKPEDELNCGACGYETCMEHAIAIYKGLAESEMCLPFAIEQFKETAKELSSSYRQLEDAQQALIQSEKLASMGQLAAGIAHEINNPLGVVLLYAHLLLDGCVKDSQMYNDLKMIAEQADRCKGIVGGLLNFARKNKVIFRQADMNEVVARCLKAIKFKESVEVVVKNIDSEIFADVDIDQIMQVFINLFINADEAMPDGGKLIITLSKNEEKINIEIKDTGYGIKQDLQKKVFEPFFTTKQIGKGTGLGLAVTYGIIKMHRGNIEVVSNADPSRGETGTTFTITLPKKQEL